MKAACENNETNLYVTQILKILVVEDGVRARQHFTPTHNPQQFLCRDRPWVSVPQQATERHLKQSMENP